MGKHSRQNTKVAVSAEEIRNRNLHLITIFAVVLLVCGSFVLGFGLRGNSTVISALGLSSLVSSDSSSTTVTDETYASLAERLNEVIELLSEESLDSYDLDTATQAVLDALADTTEDAYLCYYTADRYATLLAETSEKYSGIGVLFSEYNGCAYVVDVFEGSEAEAAGVEEGDFVVAIDGDRSFDWTVTEVVAALAAKTGEEVVITWQRASSLDDTSGEEYTTTLTCSDYTEENVSIALYEGTVGYIQLKQITSNAADLVAEAIAQLTAAGATSFILDLRDNPGGYLTQAVDIASLFVKSGIIVRIETKQASETTKNATGVSTTEGTDAPLVVLVNENTASAAEVIAAALQDNNRATIVGTTTMGKGSVQVTRELSFGGALRYTAAYYKTPNGNDIDGVGIVPDIEVSLSASEDNQLLLAIETALNLSES